MSWRRERGQRGPGRGGRLAAALVVALAIGAVAPLCSASPVGAASNGSWTFSPYSASSTSLPRAFFDYTLKPGQTVVDQAALANLTSQTVTFQIYASDAVNVTRGGAFGLLAPSSPMHFVGKWAHPGITQYSLQPHQEIVFKFTLTVPDNAAPGDYAGGLVAKDVQGTVSHSGSIDVEIQQAVGVRIFVHVPGASHPAIAIGGVHLDVHRNGVVGALTGSAKGSVTVDVANVGNATFQRVTVTLRATGLAGGRVGSFQPSVLEDLLPGSSVTTTFPWSDVPHADLYHVHVDVSTSGGTPPQPRATASVSYWDVPPLLVVIAVILLVLIAAAIFVVLRRRWRRARRAEPDGQDEPVAGRASGGRGRSRGTRSGGSDGGGGASSTRAGSGAAPEPMPVPSSSHPDHE